MPDTLGRFADLLAELWNTADAELASQIYSEQAQRTDPGTPETANGVQQIMNYVNQVHSGFPDFKLRILQQVSDRDRLVTQWTCSGTHRGEFLGVPATGKRIDVNGMTMSRVENGKIVEEQTYYDRLKLLEQMGVIPASAGSPAKSAATTR